MNLPNKLTVLRICMIPFFVAALLYADGASQSMRLLANVLFIAASLTDLLDGKIARKYNLVTNFGKFMDPLADKLLVCSALICLIELGQLPAWIVIVIISREFIISGFRLVAADNGIVIDKELFEEDNIQKLLEEEFDWCDVDRDSRQLVWIKPTIGPNEFGTDFCYYAEWEKVPGSFPAWWFDYRVRKVVA